METKMPQTILMVDDEEKNRKLLGIMLHSYGYNSYLLKDEKTALIDTVKTSPHSSGCCLPPHRLPISTKLGKSLRWD